jgi:hypothetical protein
MGLQESTHEARVQAEKGDASVSHLLKELKDPARQKKICHR